jgi:hypothetical protein
MKKLILVFWVLILWLLVLDVEAAEEVKIKVVNFTLVNADSELKIVDLSEGDVINLAELPSRNINIIANIEPNTLPLQVGSVVFTLNKKKRVENQIPFSLQGDKSGNYTSWTPPLGNYRLTATPYTESNGKGLPGISLTINLKVIDKPLNLPKAFYRINAGGPDYITPDGVIFEADNYSFSSLTSYSNKAIKDIIDTDADDLYLTEHISDKDKGQFYYYFPVPAGNYTLKLHFAEIYFGIAKKEVGNNPKGKRVFDVDVEGELLLTNFDIAAEAGAGKAVIKTFEIASSDGNIIIGFSGKVNRPKISAIEILESAAPNIPPVANAGDNKAIKLPENSTSLVGTWSDKDGTVTKVEWTQVKGPAATMKDVNTSVLELSNLVANTYIFRLTVTDNDGAIDSDEVALVVIAAEPPKITTYPNPVVDKVNISTNTESEVVMNIRLYDKYGKLSYEKLGVTVINNYELDISLLRPDIYMLHLETEGTTQKLKIMKN